MRERLRLTVRGAVQGVGFRPFAYRLARSLGLTGWVANAPYGAIVEVEGARAAIDRFQRGLRDEVPAHALVTSVDAERIDPCDAPTFEIRISDAAGTPTAIVQPDLATCDACRREIFDPNDRRYRYPFTNCTHCGPRFSIIDALPYDRARTSMRGFEMCPACAAEYHDPEDRRFHAQPIACPQCGPQLEYWDACGTVLAQRDEAMAATVRALRAGAIVAVKGLGGFHLMVDAGQEEAVARLRHRKHREEKPLAVLYPSLAEVRRSCHVSADEERLLASAEAPIVLLRRRVDDRGAIAESVAPRCPTLGVLLPYTPLHHLLAADFGSPLVATSGNVSDEPICTDERDAIVRLRGIADFLLVHNRPILRHVDDSIARLCAGRELVLRRARGYAPWPIALRESASQVVAVGGHLKNTIAVAAGSDVFVSQHIGDLDTPQAVGAFRSVLGSLDALFGVTPRQVVADMHPDYASTAFARALRLPLAFVQHHLAHVAACLAENDVSGPALGVSWDGTGYGPDGTVWGGEFLRVDAARWERAACLRPFRLPGGERAVAEPRRSAIGVLHAIYGPALVDLDLPSVRAFERQPLRVLVRALERAVNAPVTTSAGRLFDAIASILGLCQRNAFEGQAAMMLEWRAGDLPAVAYPFDVKPPAPGLGAQGRTAPPLIVDWEPMIRAIVEDVARGNSAGAIAARVHETLAQMIVSVACAIGESRVALSGGCFQNRRLTERAVSALRGAGHAPYWHRRIPPNDGGLALGQIAAFVRGWAGPPAVRARDAEEPQPIERTPAAVV